MATEAPAARRAALLDAALRHFARDGVAAARLQDIRREAGASTGSLYHWFPGGKEELAAAVAAEALGGYQAAVLGLLRDEADAERGVRAVVAHHLDWCTAHPDRARFLFALSEPALAGAVREGLGERNRAFLTDVLRWWRVHARYGALRDLDVALAHALWLGSAQEYVRLWLEGAVARPDARVRATLADAAWQAVRTPDPEGSP